MEKLSFKGDKFTILQVSDAQDLQYPRRTMLKMLERAYDRIKPDLVVFTGDNILGNHLLDARVGNKKVASGFAATYERMEKALSFLLSQPQERGIPFAMTFGNHDDMNCVTKDEQLEIYKKYSCFVGLKEPDGETCTATCNLPIYSDGKIVFNLWLIDTAWYDRDEDKCCTGVTAKTVEWYRQKSNELKALNGGEPVPSIMFQHIPFPEVERLIEKCNEGDRGAVKTKDGSYIRLNTQRAKGELHEPTPGYALNNGQFDALREQGDVLAVVFGHHHKNCFEGRIDNIDVVQTPCASFRCYGDTLRGVRVFELDRNTADSYKTKHISYFDLMGKNPVSLLRYFAQADGLGKARAIAAAGVGVAAAAATAAAILTKKKQIKYK